MAGSRRCDFGPDRAASEASSDAAKSNHRCPDRFGLMLVGEVVFYTGSIKSAGGRHGASNRTVQVESNHRLVDVAAHQHFAVSIGGRHRVVIPRYRTSDNELTRAARFSQAS
jgi:hypothetical protein